MKDDTQKKSKDFDFNGLIIFEMSKNHGGDVEHGLRIVREFADIAKKSDIKAAIKLQFRDLGSYIHPHHQKGGDERMRRYFTSHLSVEDFKRIVDETKKLGMISMSTPFDEPSVDTIDKLNVDIIKIASSSAKDWPLLERVVKSNKPIVCSTGGLTMKEIDALVDFFQKHNAQFAILHCVGMYPTPNEDKQLNRIDVMKKRYKDVPIGFSTHEDPEDYSVVKMAYAKGARLFEKHVAVLNERFAQDPSFKKVLTYTATPDQVKKWISSYKDAISMCGTEDEESYNPKEDEIKSIQTMMRGVYLKKNVQKGRPISKEDIYFAIPLIEGQVESGSWKEEVVANQDYKKDEALLIRA